MRISAILLLFIPLQLLAQTSQIIRTGRPGQSINPYTVGTKIIQLQTGYQLDENAVDTSTINNTLRYGINEKIETNLNFDLKSDNQSQSGYDNFQLGLRANFISNHNGWLTDFATQIRTRFKGSGDYEKSRQSYILTNAFAFRPIGNFSYGINLNLQTNGEDTYIEKFAAIGLGYSFTENFGIFLEPYFLKARTSETLSLNTGASYTLNESLAFDFSVGQDISEGDNKFISAGFSIRN